MAGLPTPKVEEEMVDYMNLPCPIPYEEIHREALMSLKPELFEGMRFDFTKGLNQKFSLSHSVFMGPTEIPSQSSETIKIPTAHYEFGANFIDPKLMLFGRVLTDGRLNARIKCDLTDNLTLKGNAQLTGEPHMSHGMANFDYKDKDQVTDGSVLDASDSGVEKKKKRAKKKRSNSPNSKGEEDGVKVESDSKEKKQELVCMYPFTWSTSPTQRKIKQQFDQLVKCHESKGLTLAQGKDYRTQFQLGNGALFGASYIQSVTPHLSLGGEVFWAGQQRKSGIGYAGRYNTDKMVATGQVASTGMIALSYVQKVSEKVSLASDFMYNYMSRDVTASFGYDYILRQCRLRGKIDSNGCTAAFLEERLNMGLNFILSAELDHKKKDYKFGFGLTVGE